jgi:hypothetical protein
MARTNATSILGIIALLAVIAAAVYFIYDQEDNDLEIDIGLVAQVAPYTMG